MEKVKFEQLRNKAIEEFNFENVYKYMKLVDWTWSIINQDGYIPSVKMMKRKVFDLFNDLFENNNTNVSTGGFTVMLDSDGAGISFNAEVSFIDDF